MLKISFEWSNNIRETVTQIHETASVSALETLAHLPSLSERINLSAKKRAYYMKKYLFESYTAIFRPSKDYFKLSGTICCFSSC